MPLRDNRFGFCSCSPVCKFYHCAMWIGLRRKSGDVCERNTFLGGFKQLIGVK